MYGTYQRLNLHVYASNMQVIRAAHRMLKKKAKTRAFRKERHKFLRQMLKYHQQEYAMVKEWKLL